LATVGVLPEVGSIVSGMATGGRDSGGVSIGDGVGITSTQTISTVVEDPLLDPLEEETLDPLLEPLPVLATPEPLEEPLLELTETLLPLLDPLEEEEEETMTLPGGQTTGAGGGGTSTHSTLRVGAFSALVEETLDPLDEPLDEPFPLLATPDPLLDPLLLLELTETLLPLLDPLLEEVTMMVPAGQTTSVTSTHFSALEEVEATPLSFSALDEAPVQP